MRRLLAFSCALLLAGIFCLSQQEHVSAFWQSRDSNYNVSVASGTCSQATSFLARTSGLTTLEQTTTTNLICGMVSDGDFSHLDFFHWYATNTTTTALLNLVSTSYTGTVGGVPTFTADQGFTGTSGTSSIDTHFNPSTAGGNFATGNAVIGACVLSSRTTGEAWSPIGGADPSNFADLFPLYTDGNAYVQFSGNLTSAQTNAQGLWAGKWTSSTAQSMWKNGTSIASNTAATGSAPNFDLWVLAVGNISGGFGNTSDQIAAAFAGSASVNVANISARIHTAITAMGLSGC